VAVGDKLPETKFRFFDSEGNMKEMGTEQLCKGKKVVLFAVPGAFTPTCSMKHLPGFIERAEEIKVRGCVCALEEAAAQQQSSSSSSSSTTAARGRGVGCGRKERRETRRRHFTCRDRTVCLLRVRSTTGQGCGHDCVCLHQ
jgi:hypothetical protein